MPEQEQLLAFEPPKGLFRFYAPSVTHQIVKERQIIPAFIGVSFPKTGGIFSHYLGALHPEKGMKFPQVGYAMNIVKKNVLGLLGLSSSKWMALPVLGFLLIPWKVKITILDQFLGRFTESAHIVMQTFYLHKRFYCPAAKGVWQLIYLFLRELGFSQIVCQRISEMLAAFIQFDDVYRYKVQDVFTMTTKERLLENPRREVLNLLGLYVRRERADASKLGSIAAILSWVLLVPKVKRAFQEAVRLTDINKIKYDEADMYFTLIKGQYDYMGLPVEMRKHTYLTIHNGQVPPWIEVWYEG